MSNNKIYVGNLPFSASETELKDLFQEFGEISEAVVVRDRFSNQSKGFGFVTFASEEGAKAAVSMDGKDFQGRPLRVNEARDAGAGGGAKRSFGGGRGGDRRPSGGGRGGDDRRDRW